MKCHASAFGPFSFRRAGMVVWVSIFLAFVVFVPKLYAENAANVSISAADVTVTPSVSGVTFMNFRVVDPGGVLIFDQSSDGGTIQWHLPEGSPDGHYSYEVRTGFVAKRTVEKGAVSPRTGTDSPPLSRSLRPRGQSGGVLVQDGAIVLPTEELGFLNRLGSGVKWVLSGLWDLAVPSAFADQVILDDLIVTSSECVGFDCVNGESFGFDTLRLKENNLRIKFQDTSSSASFPTNDWQITANDSTNGGLNKFSIDDIDGGRTPFTIEAGAGNNALFIDDNSRVGLGTATPEVDLHILGGDTPTVRLAQDGSMGWIPQTWDVAGNEANFFVRDATNGSSLPFRIRPGAPTSSLDIASDGKVGLGTAIPATGLHIYHNVTDTALSTVRIQSKSQIWDIAANDTGFSVRDETNKDDAEQAKIPLMIRPAAPTNSLFIASDGKVGLGTAEPFETLHVQGNVYVSANLELGSSRAYKNNIHPLAATEALAVLKGLQPVKYNYKSDPAEESLGFIAEEVPDLVATNSRKSVSPMDFVAVLAKVIQEQQKTIEGLAEKVAALENERNAGDRGAFNGNNL